ncbi:Omp28 family outer membrane lipoprotein [Prevotella sp. E9-3]|uniref:Omp28 family outer membrane lipoprotein n=1 Tax=Prevotella sp. E9-3 TaxID=2913621 RepID=UPI001EDB24B2|nr:Omp28 family outer membrane lipoprotein [Prevotella sp. E9-3]UKK48970.1 Omp28 family outer membrane lipoprotein [Prevotella sp. E9-3]
MNKLYILLALLPLFFSCDHIDEADRLIEVSIDNTGENAIYKNILIEDFTGQRCVNCPKGSQAIEQLQESDFGSRIVAVGIHSGPFGKNASGTKLLSLATQTGCDYFDYWKVEAQPGALINRQKPILYTVLDWTTEVGKQLATKANLSIVAEAKVNGSNIDITVSEKAIENVAGKLQVWVIEDNIVDIQTMPDAPDENPDWTGGNKRDYVHNHVFRTSVNDPMGDDFSINKDEEKQQSFVQALDAAWNPANLSVVVFVYNDNGVEQVVKSKVESLTQK